MSSAADPNRPPLEPEILFVQPAVMPGRARRVGPGRPRRRVAPLILYVLTWFTTCLAGMFYAGKTDTLLEAVWEGLRYSGPVMLILTAHEMGHFLQAVRYGIPASLPWFIPMPPVLFGGLVNPFGTMGAVIVQAAGVATRRQLFDIAISGPLAGLMVTVPVLLWGLSQSSISEFSPDDGGLRFGDPLVLKWLAQWYMGPLGPNQDYNLNPPLLAGWVGIFITALNLIPIGQLDGGHILYCLLGPPARKVARWLYAGLIAGVLLGSQFLDSRYMSWTVLLFLLWLMRVEHPPTTNDQEPLGAIRILLGWLTLGFLIVGFTPIPIMT